METVRLSKLLSFILRHGAIKEGIPIRNDGFILIQDLLKHRKFQNITLQDIEQVVEKDEKNRYTLELMDDEWMIRANQGHSLAVQVDLVSVEADELPIVVHGTYHKAWELIKTQGLSKMNRQHIHFAVGKLGEEGVKSGMRKNCTVFIYIDTKKAIADGIQFYRSANNVILSSGINGYIHPSYFLKVQDKKGNDLEY